MFTEFIPEFNDDKKEKNGKKKDIRPVKLGGRFL
jgi:hypothetical protein